MSLLYYFNLLVAIKIAKEAKKLTNQSIFVCVFPGLQVRRWVLDVWSWCRWPWRILTLWSPSTQRTQWWPLCSCDSLKQPWPTAAPRNTSDLTVTCSHVQSRTNAVFKYSSLWVIVTLGRICIVLRRWQKDGIISVLLSRDLTPINKSLLSLRAHQCSLLICEIRLHSERLFKLSADSFYLLWFHFDKFPRWHDAD